MKKNLFLRFLSMFLFLALSVNLIGCGGSGSGSKYYESSAVGGDMSVVNSLTDIDPATPVKITDGANFDLVIPANSLNTTFSIDVTKTDLSGKNEAEIALIAKSVGLPEGYYPTSNFYNIGIKGNKTLLYSRASIVMDTSALLNKHASLMLSAFENLDWNTNDYYIAALEGNGGKDSWFFVPTTKNDVLNSLSFLIESNSLAKSYCIAKKAKSQGNTDPVEPQEKTLISSLEINADRTSVEIDENKKYLNDVNVSFKVSYTGNIDQTTKLSNIKLYSVSNFEFSEVLKANQEGGIYVCNTELTQFTSGASDITYSFTIPLANQTYNKDKHPTNVFIDASLTIDNITYRPSKVVAINLLAPSVDPTPSDSEPVHAYVVELANGDAIWIDEPIKVAFNQPMDKESLKSAIKLFNSAGSEISSNLYDISFVDEDECVLITPLEGCFTKDTKAYKLSVVGGQSGAKSLSGSCLTEDVTLVFDISPFKGKGTKLIPYEISTAEELDYVRNYLYAHYIQTCDIDLAAYCENYDDGDDDPNTKGWLPIGNEKQKFLGTYNGNHHKVYNLYINRESLDNVGLFSFIQGDIRNLGVEIGTEGVRGKSYVGAIAGKVETCNISGCYATGNVAGSTFIGGLFGCIQNVKLMQCCADCGVTTDVDMDVAGGLVAKAESSEIKQCYSKGSVSVGNGGAGGLVGNMVSGEIHDCYSTATVNGKNNSGGLAGQFYGIMTYCYASGDVTISYGVGGGLIGYLGTATVFNSVALNGSINGGSSDVNRIYGVCWLDKTISNCYANSMMSGTWTSAERGHDTINGSDVMVGGILSEEGIESFWKNPSKWKDNKPWDESIWDFTPGGTPTLKNMPM